jgi:hypothetical protein
MRSALAASLLIASVVASSAAFADMAPQVRTKFVTMCQKQMYMAAPQCGCMADIAAKKLDDLSIQYLSLDALDVTHSAAISKQMTSKELGAVDGYMKTAPHACEAVR